MRSFPLAFLAASMLIAAPLVSGCTGGQAAVESDDGENLGELRRHGMRCQDTNTEWWKDPANADGTKADCCDFVQGKNLEDLEAKGLDCEGEDAEKCTKILKQLRDDCMSGDIPS